MLPPNINTINSSSNIMPSSKEGSASLRMGQIVNFTLVSQSKNYAIINIAGQKLSSQITSPLPENKQLQATVTQLKPEIKLEIKQPTNQPNQTVLAQTLKNLLPAQTPIKNEIQQLLNLQVSGKLPAAVQSQLTSLINTLLKINPTLNGADIRSAFANSGLFLENKLFNSKTSKKDFKANLFRLLDKLENSQTKSTTPETSQLHKSTKQLLNKVTIQQIQAIENQAINIELPVVSKNSSIELNVDIRKKQFNENTIWEIITDLNLEQGKMVVKSTLVNEEITFQIWAEPSHLLENIKQQINSFKELLTQSEVHYKNIFFLKKAPAVNTSAKKIALIDIKV